MTRREVKQKFRTILQTIGAVILLCCALLTWGFFNQPTGEEVIDKKVVEIKEENEVFIDEVVATLTKYQIEDNKLEPILVVEKPDFEMNSNQTFLDSVNACIDYIYRGFESRPLRTKK